MSRHFPVIVLLNAGVLAGRSLLTRHQNYIPCNNLMNTVMAGYLHFAPDLKALFDSWDIGQQYASAYSRQGHGFCLRRVLNEFTYVINPPHLLLSFVSVSLSWLLRVLSLFDPLSVILASLYSLVYASLSLS